jgi:hypothetical protein
MYEIITKRAKEIITCLTLVIIILLALLSKNSLSKPNSFDTQLLNPKLLTFLNYLNDKHENVHGVMGLAPNGHDKLKIFGVNFEEINHCYWNPKEDIKPDGKRIEIPKECLKENIKIDLNSKQQYIVLTKATIKTESGDEVDALFISDLDHKVKCVRWDGSPC